MSPEERDLLNHSIEIAEENNRILRVMRRNARIATFFRITYWLIIIGAAFGAYYFIQPYTDAIIKSYGEMKENVENIKNITTKLPDLPAWLGGEKQ